MMAEFKNICGQVGSGREEIPLCGTFNISASEETSLAQGKLGDQRTVILETDSVLVVGIKASEAPRVVIPEDFCFDGADGKGLASAKVGDRNAFFPGGGSNCVETAEVKSAAVVQQAAM